MAYFEAFNFQRNRIAILAAFLPVSACQVSTDTAERNRNVQNIAGCYAAEDIGFIRIDLETVNFNNSQSFEIRAYGQLDRSAEYLMEVSPRLYYVPGKNGETGVFRELVKVPGYDTALFLRTDQDIEGDAFFLNDLSKEGLLFRRADETVCI